jgi:folate receptor
MKVSSIATTILSLTSFGVVLGWEDSCTQFKNIYTSGTDLCERMWDDAFEVVDDDTEPAYTMWFFDHENNPNDQVTREIFGPDTVPDKCHLNYFHKDFPTPEDDGMRECHPWKNAACCDSSTTVASVDTINEAYGEGYQWDRCGPMSQACERFFVMEACFYECEPSAGLVRIYE